MRHKIEVHKDAWGEKLYRIYSSADGYSQSLAAFANLAHAEDYIRNKQYKEPGFPKYYPPKITREQWIRIILLGYIGIAFLFLLLGFLFS